MTTMTNRIMRVLDAYPDRWFSPARMSYYIGGTPDAIRGIFGKLHEREILDEEVQRDDIESMLPLQIEEVMGWSDRTLFSGTC